MSDLTVKHIIQNIEASEDDRTWDDIPELNIAWKNYNKSIYKIKSGCFNPVRLREIEKKIILDIIEKSEKLIENNPTFDLPYALAIRCLLKLNDRVDYAKFFYAQGLEKCARKKELHDSFSDGFFSHVKSKSDFLLFLASCVGTCRLYPSENSVENSVKLAGSFLTTYIEHNAESIPSDYRDELLNLNLTFMRLFGKEEKRAIELSSENIPYSGTKCYELLKFLLFGSFVI